MVSLGQVIALIKAMGGSGGGSSLPSVSSTDNGDVLTVVNGAWDKAAPSGGSDLPDTPAQDGTYTLQNTVSSGSGTLAWGADMFFELHLDEETWAFDKTWQEIYDALSAGKVGFFPMVYYAPEDNTVQANVNFVTLAYQDFAENNFVISGLYSNNLSNIGYADTANDYPILD